MSVRVLMIDDEKTFGSLLCRELERIGHSVKYAEDGESALAILAEHAFDVILLDIRLGAGDGIALMGKFKKQGVDAEVILLTGHASLETAVAALRKGAFDYLSKPCKLSILDAAVKRAAEHHSLKKSKRILEFVADKSPENINLIGNSDVMHELKEMILRVAAADCTALICGESGTGKELVARNLHLHSGRASKSFLAINCAAIPATTLENELFGHEKAAFTGANAKKQGIFEALDGGTLFLDEIGDMALNLQTKMLRVLEAGEIRPIGAVKSKRVDVRIIAATNADLESLVQEGTVREDLYYRLNVVKIVVPPLRDRKSDIPMLVRAFAAEFDASEREFHESAMQALKDYHWPGNVRELWNAVQRTLILSKSETIHADDIHRFLENRIPARTGPASKASDLASAERSHILLILQQVAWNKKQAASLLGVSVKTVYNKIREHSLSPD